MAGRDLAACLVVRTTMGQLVDGVWQPEGFVRSRSGLAEDHHRATFRWFLIKNAFTADGIRQLAAQSRFGGGDVRNDRVAFELRLVKPSTWMTATGAWRHR